MIILTNQSGKPITLAQELGHGGEGAVYALAGRKDVVAKLYHSEHRTAQREAKLAAMVAHPPLNTAAAITSDPPSSVPPALAWPSELLYEKGTFAGFVMPRIDHCPNIFEVYNPKLRAMRYPQVDRRFLHHAARNLAIVLAGLHTAGYVIGDVNQKNILVNRHALVTLVDADSFQVATPKGEIFRCAVGVPEYTPPELQGKVLAQFDRRPQHDYFGLGVLLFQLLMEGYHPFTGRPVAQSMAEVSQLSIHCIQHGIFPYQANGDVQPPPGAPNFDWLYPDLQQLFVTTFLLGFRTPESRPNALLWARALSNAEASLGRCDRNPSHWYSRHLERCPYCVAPQTVVRPSRALPGSRAIDQGWQRKPQSNQGMPIGCWVDIINALLLPILIVLGIPILLWLLKSGLFMLPLAGLGILARTGLLKQVAPWLVRMAGYTLLGMQQAWRWAKPRATFDVVIAFGFGIVMFAFVISTILGAIPKASPPLPTQIVTRVPATQVVSPISPLTVSPLATPTK